MKYLQQLDRLLERKGISKNRYMLSDETGRVRYGDGFGIYQIVYQPQNKK